MLNIDKPKNFRMKEVLIINAIGIIPGALCGVGVGGPILLVCGIFAGKYGLIALGILLLFISGVALFFMPFALGNLYVLYLVKRFFGRNALPESSFVVQAAFRPRLHGGLRGFLEDADDVGVLRLDGETVSFDGDHVRFSLPFGRLNEVSHSNSGWRGLWITGRRIKITTDAFDGYKSIELIERQSSTVVSASRISKEIIHGLEGATPVKHATV